MKNRKPKIYAVTWYVVIQDSRGLFMESTRALTAVSAEKQCSKLASFIGGRIVRVLKAA